MHVKNLVRMALVWGAFWTLSQQAAADIIYEVDETFSANDAGAGLIRIMGTITTDGTLGTLGQANLVDFGLEFSNPGGAQPSYTLTPANSIVDISDGAYLSATANQLDFVVPIPAVQFSTFPQILFSDNVGGPDISWRILSQDFGTPDAEIRVQLDTDGNGPLANTVHLTSINPMLGPVTYVASTQVVPEPGSAGLLLFAGALFGWARRTSIRRT